MDQIYGLQQFFFFFWRQLQKINFLFNWSFGWVVRDGTSIYFIFGMTRGWRAFSRPCGFKPAGMGKIYIFLKDACTTGFNIISPHPDQLPMVQFTQGRDELFWRWSSSGCCSAKSFYNTIMRGGKIAWYFMHFTSSCGHIISRE